MEDADVIAKMDETIIPHFSKKIHPYPTFPFFDKCIYGKYTDLRLQSTAFLLPTRLYSSPLLRRLRSSSVQRLMANDWHEGRAFFPVSTRVYHRVGVVEIAPIVDIFFLSGVK